MELPSGREAFFSLFALFFLRDVRILSLLVLERRADEPAEERVRPRGLALELGVVLHGHEERVVVELHDLDEVAVRVHAADEEAGRLQRSRYSLLNS